MLKMNDSKIDVEINVEVTHKKLKNKLSANLHLDDFFYRILG